MLQDAAGPGAAVALFGGASWGAGSLPECRTLVGAWQWACLPEHVSADQLTDVRGSVVQRCLTAEPGLALATSPAGSHRAGSVAKRVHAQTAHAHLSHACSYLPRRTRCCSGALQRSLFWRWRPRPTARTWRAAARRAQSTSGRRRPAACCAAGPRTTRCCRVSVMGTNSEIMGSMDAWPSRIVTRWY